MQVHQAFNKEWSEKVFRSQRQKPDWEEFQKEYGQYVPRVPYTQGHIKGEDMFKTVQKIRKTVPGLDGWRIHELKALGVEAWHQRARIVEIQLKVGKVPASYKQVSTPMMPKTKGTEKIMDHRGLGHFLHPLASRVRGMVPQTGRMAGRLAARRGTWGKIGT